MKEAIEEGFFITTEGKAGHLIYIAKFPEQKNKIHILKNAIEKLATHKKYFQIQFLKKAIQKIKDAIPKNKIELWPTDSEHSILDTHFYTNLGTGTESESKESPIEHLFSLGLSFKKPSFFKFLEVDLFV